MSLVVILKTIFQGKDLTTFKVFEDYLIILLKASGFDILSKEFFCSPRNRLITSVMTTIHLIGLLSSTYVIWKYSRNIEELITGTISFIMFLQLGSKLIELVIDRKIHREMLKIIKQNTQLMEMDPECKGFGIANFKNARFIMGFSTVVYTTALISLVLYPIIIFLVNNEYKLGANLELPGTNNKDPIGWLVNYLFSVIMATFACVPILAYDVLIYTYVFYIKGRFQIFEHQVTMVGDFSSAYNTDEKQHKLIIKCSQLHSETLEFIQKCSNMFSMVFLFVSLSDFVVFCIAIVHFQLDIFASSTFMCIGAIVQTLILSICGQIVQNSVENSSRAIYNSFWYRLKRKDQRKIILFMLMQSQKHIGFKAGCFSISLEWFMNIFFDEISISQVSMNLRNLKFRSTIR